MSNLFYNGSAYFRNYVKAKREPRTKQTYHELARDLPIFAETDVLIAGGGPAGTSAAIAAGRLGASVILLERYNHLGGLSTGGLVIWIDRMTDWNGKRVIAGIASDYLERLPKDAIMGPSPNEWGSKDELTSSFWRQRAASFKNIVTFSPTIDPEALKTLSMVMIMEQNVRLLFHSWVVEPIVENGVVRGVIFESKEGRQAIMSKVVIDSTGDADLIARVGHAFESDIEEKDIHHSINTPFLVGGIQMNRWLAFREKQTEEFLSFKDEGKKKLELFEFPECSWRNDVALFLGPRLGGYNGLNVEDLTEVDLRSRLLTVDLINFYREHAPGFEDAFLMLGASQIGVRHTRRLIGTNKIRRSQWDDGTVWKDEIGVSTSPSPQFPNISIPYGSLLPNGIDGILGAGRHIACDASSHSFLREIPQCWITGQAAGIAAALSSGNKTTPHKIDYSAIQRELLHQGAYLSPQIIQGLDSL